jgi:tetratricopeptide (TPR) repeat protein
VHETTEDERYTEPADTLARLDRWVADPRVRSIAITGIGGLGKTALVGHWLKQHHGAAARPTAGLFGWSFNANRQLDHFLDALVQFAVKDLGLSPPDRRTRRVDAAVAVLRAVPLVVVLDGLEILQEPPGELTSAGPEPLAYGEFLDDNLRAFLDAACRLPHPGLVVLTSRFPFADLTGFLGSSLRLLPLERLAATEGAELLGRLDVKGSDQDRQVVSRRLDGHPLALRVFAATLARQAHGDPTRLLDMAFTPEGLGDDDPLEAKLRQLLGFYQTQLPDTWQALLGVVALFPSQVTLATALDLARQLPGIADRLKDVTDAQLRGARATLAADGLLTRELDQAGQERYACHPVIRGHFRAALVGRDPEFAVKAAGLLTGAVSGHVETMEELGVVTNAIALLLDAGEAEQADALYRERIGAPPVFFHLPAPREGVRCALGFVATSQRRRLVREQLSVHRLSFYLNEVGLFARHAGSLELADRYFQEGADLDRQQGDDLNLSVQLTNHASLLIDLGRLADAETAAREAVELAGSDQAKERDALVQLGTTLGLQGQISQAIAAFDTANDLQHRIDAEKAWVYSFNGVKWAELLIRLGRAADARSVTEANLIICRRNQWQDGIARCYWLLGCLDTLADADDDAATHLTEAATILRGAQLLPDLSQVLLARANLDRRRRALGDAERHVDEALAIVSSRRMAVLFADALVLRGCIHLDRGHTAEAGAGDTQRRFAEHALDDADDARILAQRHSYAWAERDAALLRADAYTTLGDAERAHDARRQAEHLDRRMKPAT